MCLCFEGEKRENCKICRRQTKCCVVYTCKSPDDTETCVKIVGRNVLPIHCSKAKAKQLEKQKPCQHSCNFFYKILLCQENIDQFKKINK